jgi:aspartate aminotransferase
MRLSSRAQAAAESRTLSLSARVARLRAEGADVVSLLEGEPDLPVPAPVLRATEEALRAGRTRYSTSAGLPELRAAIAAKLERENGVRAAPDGVLVTNGAKQALYEVLQALCGPGDEVIVLSPYWVTFPEAVKLAGAVPVVVETGRGGTLDVDAVGRALGPATRAIIVNSPNNPTGAVYPADALRALAALAEGRDLTLISDEAYEGLVYDGARHVSVASTGAAAAARTVTIQTFSKSFAMTGYRVGYAAGPEALMRAAARVHGHVTGNVCTFAQHGALAALGLGAEHRESWRAAHQARRDLAFSLASRLFHVEKPPGGLFLWADARARFDGRRPDSALFAERLLEKGGVAAVPGSACGREGFLRLSFSQPEAVLREAYRRIEAAL